jgi:hypothetical protein
VARKGSVGDGESARIAPARRRQSATAIKTIATDCLVTAVRQRNGSAWVAIPPRTASVGPLGGGMVTGAGVSDEDAAIQRDGCFRAEHG